MCRFFAFLEGQKESQAYRQNLIQTGNAAGVTATQLAAMAASVSASSAEYFAKNLQQVGFSSYTKALLTTIKEAVAASQAATQQSLNTLIEDAVRKSVEAAVRPAVEQAVKPIDDRVARMERAAKAKEKTSAP